MLIKTLLNGKKIEAQGEFVGGTLWVHYEGRTFAVAAETKKKRRTSGGSAGGGDLEAPMPGKITKILKNAGEAVRRGDAVLVMEAMKMEYTLKAEADGKITSLSAQVGEQVALGQLLVKIEKAGGAS